MRTAGRRLTLGDWMVLLAAVAGLLVVYGLTGAPDLSWSNWGTDGGDLAAAAVSGRVPHPPGFPLYMLIARAVVRLPFGSPAGRLNLLSAGMAAGTALLVGVGLCVSGTSRLVGISGALALGLSGLVWSQAGITEVYTMAAFFATLAWVVALKGGQARKGLSGFFAGLVLGLAVAVHPVCLALAVLWWRVRGRELRRWMVGLGLGLLPYAALPLMGSWPQPWGDLSNWSGWWAYVMARMYWPLAGGLPIRLVPARGLAWLVLGLRQLTPLGAVLAVVGAAVSARSWRSERERVVDLGAGALAAVALVSVYAIAYDTPDSFVYLVPFVPLGAFWLGVGAAALERRARWVAWIALLVPALLGVWNAPQMSLRGDREAMDWIRATLAQAPPEALVITAQDPHTFALWYAQDALGLRADVTVVDEDLWQFEAYRGYLAKRAGIGADALDGGLADRTVCRVGEEGKLMCQ